VKLDLSQNHAKGMISKAQAGDSSGIKDYCDPYSKPKATPSTTLRAPLAGRLKPPRSPDDANRQWRKATRA